MIKGIILAGGLGTRLYPLTATTSKQLLPVNNKPMIYYPLSVLMKAGIRDILIISTPKDTPNFIKLLGDGSKYGINLQYTVQPSPNGLAQAFILGKDFIGKDKVAVILGDNIFLGSTLINHLNNAFNKLEDNNGAVIFAHYVDNPEEFGIVEFDNHGKVVSIEEKPKNPKSNYCVTGLYLYDNRVTEYVNYINPSKRGELEITDLNRIYLDKDKLNVEILEKEFTWIDTGTHESLAKATSIIKSIEEKEGYKIACLDEISRNNGWI